MNNEQWPKSRWSRVSSPPTPPPTPPPSPGGRAGICQGFIWDRPFIARGSRKAGSSSAANRPRACQRSPSEVDQRGRSARVTSVTLINGDAVDARTFEASAFLRSSIIASDREREREREKERERVFTLGEYVGRGKLGQSTAGSMPHEIPQ